MRDRISTSRATRSSAGSLASPSLWLWGIVIWAHDVGVAVLLTSVVAAAISIRCIVMAVRDVADIRDVLAETDLGTPTA